MRRSSKRSIVARIRCQCLRFLFPGRQYSEPQRRVFCSDNAEAMIHAKTAFETQASALLRAILRGQSTACCVHERRNVPLRQEHHRRFPDVDAATMREKTMDCVRESRSAHGRRKVDYFCAEGPSGSARIGVVGSLDWMPNIDGVAVGRQRDFCPVSEKTKNATGMFAERL